MGLSTRAAAYRACSRADASSSLALLPGGGRRLGGGCGDGDGGGLRKGAEDLIVGSIQPWSAARKDLAPSGLGLPGLYLVSVKRDDALTRSGEFARAGRRPVFHGDGGGLGRVCAELRTRRCPAVRSDSGDKVSTATTRSGGLGRGVRFLGRGRAPAWASRIAAITGSASRRSMPRVIRTVEIRKPSEKCLPRTRTGKPRDETDNGRKTAQHPKARLITDTRIPQRGEARRRSGGGASRRVPFAAPSPTERELGRGGGERGSWT